MRWTGTGQAASEAFLFVPDEAHERYPWEGLCLASRPHRRMDTVANCGSRLPKGSTSRITACTALPEGGARATRGCMLGRETRHMFRACSTRAY